jgi:hypothetical protein
MAVTRNDHPAHPDWCHPDRCETDLPEARHARDTEAWELDGVHVAPTVICTEERALDGGALVAEHWGARVVVTDRATGRRLTLTLSEDAVAAHVVRLGGLLGQVAALRVGYTDVPDGGQGGGDFTIDGDDPALDGVEGGAGADATDAASVAADG